MLRFSASSCGILVMLFAFQSQATLGQQYYNPPVYSQTYSYGPPVQYQAQSTYQQAITGQVYAQPAFNQHPIQPTQYGYAFDSNSNVSPTPVANLNSIHGTLRPVSPSAAASSAVPRNEITPVTAKATVSAVAQRGPARIDPVATLPPSTKPIIETFVKTLAEIFAKFEANRIVENKVELEPESSLPTPGLLEELIEIERRIDRILPDIIPAVVSIDGGSGVIVSSDGYVLTAAHVTRKSGRKLTVRLQDGRTVSAVTLGTNVNSDTAALKLNGSGPWPYLKMTDSTSVKTGDWCLAFGYPLSFNRDRPSAVRVGRILEFSKGRFVTDCPIMGGDSGGPLINLNGNLIGISSRVKNDINQNLHVPIQNFQDEWTQLAASVDVAKKATNTQKQAYLGILGETDIDRVRIRRVYEDSPAEIAGMVENDVILQLDGKPIEKFDDVIAVLQIRKPGEQVVAKLNRFGKLLNVEILLGPNARKRN